MVVFEEKPTPKKILEVVEWLWPNVKGRSYFNPDYGYKRFLYPLSEEMSVCERFRPHVVRKDAELLFERVLKLSYGDRTFVRNSYVTTTNPKQDFLSSHRVTINGTVILSDRTVTLQSHGEKFAQAVWNFTCVVRLMVESANLKVSM